MITVIPARETEPASPHEKPHLSASQLRTFSDCSLKWQLSRLYKPEFTGSSLVFGSAFHAGMQACSQARIEGDRVSTSLMLSAYDTSLLEHSDEDIKYSDRESPESLRELAGRMYQAYLDHSLPGSVIAVEERILVEIDPGLPPLLGYIDLMEVVRDDTGRETLHIVDFKTSARKPSEESVPFDQLLLYAMAVLKTGFSDQLGLPITLRYDYITKTKNPEYIPVEAPYEQTASLRTLERARVIYRGMEQELCYPNPGWMCSGCGYQARCREWPSSSQNPAPELQ